MEQPNYKFLLLQLQEKSSRLRELVKSADDEEGINAQEFHCLYFEIAKLIDQIAEYIDNGEADDRFQDEYNQTFNLANYFYENGVIYANVKESKEATESKKEIEIAKKEIRRIGEKVENAQPIQLAVFSVVLAVLSFILTNAKHLTAESSFKTILLINLSYLFMCVVLFSFVYLFLSLPRKEPKSKISAIIIMIILAAIVLVGIIIVAGLQL